MAIIRPSNPASFAMDVSSMSGREPYQTYLSSDHTLPSESLGHELSYAPSPDSLYMYDQERREGQGAPGMCSPDNMAVLPPVSFGRCLEECDNSSPASDLLLPSGSCLESLTMVEFGEFNWDEKDKEFVDIEDVFQDRKDVNQGPTLAQLNFDSFADDGRSYRLANPSQAPSTASTTEDWTGLEDFTHADPCGPPQSVSYSGSTNPPMNWNEISQGIPGSSTATDIKYPLCSPPSLSTAPPTQPPVQYTMLKTVVKTESPAFSSCSSSMGHQSLNSSSDLAAKKSSGLHRLLLQSPVTGHASSSTENASQTITPAHMVQTRKRPFPEDTPIYSKSNSVEQKWEEIKQFIHAGSVGATCESQEHIKRERLDSESSVLTSLDDIEVGYRSEDSDIDGEEDEDYQSEPDTSDSDEGSSVTSPNSSKSKEKQYFWQYNVQSKGPKGKKLCFALDTSNPHVLSNFEDPVFDPGHKVPGITHGGKARRGDGNDIYPNPKKLCQIGNELKRLNKRINGFSPLTDMPSAVRSRSRKEKNKLASRACRLKKKAQHEANKIKLMGLEQEHSQLLCAINLSKQDVVRRVKGAADEDAETLTVKLEHHIQTHLKHMIAGHSTDFVNGVIKLVNGGDPKGGLCI